MRIPFFDRFVSSQSVLLVGCSGGCDIVSAIPLMTWLRDQGKLGMLANVTFAVSEAVESPRLSGWGAGLTSTRWSTSRLRIR